MNDYLKEQISKLDAKIKDAQNLAASDPSMAELAGEEIKSLEEEKEQMLSSVIANPSLFAEKLYLSREKQSSSEIATSSFDKLKTPRNDNGSVILEIRAAAGGNEAGLFASDL